MENITAQLNKMVPDFNLKTTSEKTITLDALRGKNSVLYFYPKDSTPGCTIEGKDFRDAYPQFQALNTEIYGVSRDNLVKHEKFKQNCSFPFELISDPDEVLCELFNVMAMKSMFGKKYRGLVRSTFLIDAKGILRQEWRDIKIKNHVKEVLAAVKEL